MTDRARVSLPVALVALIPIMIGCARLAPELIAPAHGRYAAPSIAPSSTEPPSPPPTLEMPRDRDGEGDVDLYGNDVTDAVAKYKLDADGSLYELHSPQTQLPRLGRPRS